MIHPAMAQSALEVNCSGKGVCREAQTGMPLKVLPRPFSNLYKSKEDSEGNILKANVRAFYPLYAFARDDLDVTVPNEPKGWYQVGESAQGQPTGWMRAKDVLEWKQALIVSYTHPGEGDEARSRVLMFQDRDRLKSLIEGPNRAETFKSLYAALKQQQVPDGVVSKEPERFVDITEKFYMLPIVDFEMVNLQGDEARYLQLAAAVPGQRSDTDTLANPEFRTQSTQGSDLLVDLPAVKNLGVDLVFVMDMTASMQPYLDRTKEAIKAIATETTTLAEAKGHDTKIHFGLVGYRDDLKAVPDLGFVSKDFTPTLVNADEFGKLLDTEAKAATTSAGDYPEEVFAGMKTGLATHWDDNALKFLILVGDASSHPVGHPQNTTGLDEKTLHIMADDAQVHVLALHLNEARAESDHATASEQFGALAKERGPENSSALVEIDVEDKASFKSAVKVAADQVVALIERIDQATKMVESAPPTTGSGEAGGIATNPGIPSAATPGEPETAMPLQDKPPSPPVVSTVPPAVTDAPAPSAPVPAATPTEGVNPDPVVQTKAAMQRLIDSALVEYLGKNQTPPRDVIAWAFDRDPLNPATTALDVRVLLTKQQLSDLVTKLEFVTQALKMAELTQMAFFDALSSVAAGTVKNPDQIKNADKLKGAGLLDAFIESLPYKSDILSLSNEMYAAMTPTERAELERGLEAKLALYRIVNEDVDGWVKLNEGDDDAQKVYPLQLGALP
jgi:hypothetical protein